jgi:hypothetical protein
LKKGCLDVDGKPEFRIRKAKEDGGGTAFAGCVWKPVVLIDEIHGARLSKSPWSIVASLGKELQVRHEFAL